MALWKVAVSVALLSVLLYWSNEDLNREWRRWTATDGPPKEAQKTVLIFGGRGQQGRGAIEYIMENGENNWKIRTIARNASKSEDLSALGVEIWEGDPYDPTVLESALKGVDAVFGMTFSDFEGGKEFSHGKALGDAVKAAQVHTLVFSGGEQTNIPFLDVKYEIEQYIRELGIPFTVFLHTCFFFENLVSKGGNKRVQQDEEKGLLFSTPLPVDLKIPMISAWDIGRIAAASILHPERFHNGQQLGIVGETVSCQQFVNCFVEESGMNASYVTMPLEDFEKKPIPGAKAIADMYRWFINKGHSRSNEATKKVYPQVQSLAQWMKSFGVHWIKEQAQG